MELNIQRFVDYVTFDYWSNGGYGQLIGAEWNNYDGSWYDRVAASNLSSKTVLTNTFTGLHYVFTGWNTKADGTGVSIPEGITYREAYKLATGEEYSSGSTYINLYAQWETEYNNIKSSNQHYHDITNAIRAKSGSNTTYLPSQMANAIINLSGNIGDITNGYYSGQFKTESGTIKPNTFVEFVVWGEEYKVRKACSKIDGITRTQCKESYTATESDLGSVWIFEWTILEWLDQVTSFNTIDCVTPPDDDNEYGIFPIDETSWDFYPARDVASYVNYGATPFGTVADVFSEFVDEDIPDIYVYTEDGYPEGDCEEELIANFDNCYLVTKFAALAQSNDDGINLSFVTEETGTSDVWVKFQATLPSLPSLPHKPTHIISVDVYTGEIYMVPIKIINEQTGTFETYSPILGAIALVYFASKKELINFYIEDTMYYADKDMTWGEWLESSYNTDGYQRGYIDGIGDVPIITFGNLSFYVSPSVNCDVTIDKNYSYELLPFMAGGGGSN